MPRQLNNLQISKKSQLLRGICSYAVQELSSIQREAHIPEMLLLLASLVLFTIGLAEMSRNSNHCVVEICLRQTRLVIAHQTVRRLTVGLRRRFVVATIIEQAANATTCAQRLVAVIPQRRFLLGVDVTLQHRCAIVTKTHVVVTQTDRIAGVDLVENSYVHAKDQRIAPAARHNAATPKRTAPEMT